MIFLICLVLGIWGCIVLGGYLVYKKEKKRLERENRDEKSFEKSERRN